MNTPDTMCDTHLGAALQALQQHSIVPGCYGPAAALAHPLYGRLVRMHATALALGQRPYPPPAHVRPSVMAPAAPLCQHTHRYPWAHPAWTRQTQPFDAKAAAAGMDKDWS